MAIETYVKGAFLARGQVIARDPKGGECSDNHANRKNIAMDLVNKINIHDNEYMLFLVGLKVMVNSLVVVIFSCNEVK